MKKAILIIIMSITSNIVIPEEDSLSDPLGEYLKSQNEIKDIEDRIQTNVDLEFEFKKNLIKMADTLNINVNHLLTVIHVETIGTFDCSIKSPIGAVGLIQFTKSTAKWIGTTPYELSKMSRSEQLYWVAKYFDTIIKYYGSLNNLEDVFMAVHYPSAIRISKHGTVYKKGSKAYNANKFNDKNADGKVTKYEICSFVRSIYNKYYLKYN